MGWRRGPSGAPAALPTFSASLGRPTSVTWPTASAATSLGHSDGIPRGHRGDSRDPPAADFREKTTDEPLCYVTRWLGANTRRYQSRVGTQHEQRESPG